MPTGKPNAPFLRAAVVLLTVTAVVFFHPCKACPAGPAPLEKIHVGYSVLWVEIALTPEAQSRGLMFRDSLPWDQGMLFVYDRPQHLTFWMKNTTIPLDIAFISPEGRIEEILSMKPLSEKVYRSGAPALYALEVNRGWFRKKGVKVGDRIRF